MDLDFSGLFEPRNDLDQLLAQMKAGEKRELDSAMRWWLILSFVHAMLWLVVIWTNFNALAGFAAAIGAFCANLCIYQSVHGDGADFGKMQESNERMVGFLKEMKK